jgi:hypothetical protein
MFPSNKYLYDAKIEVEINNSCGISKIFTLKEYKDLKFHIKNENNASFSYSFNTIEDFTQDFVFVLQPKEAFKPMALIEQDKENNSLAIFLNYYPSYDHLDVDLFEPKSEIIFVCDRVHSNILI